MAGTDSETVELFVLGGTDVGRSAKLGEGAWIGRAEGCALRLAGRSISRRHARLERRGEAWILTDQGSTNGLWLDDERVGEVQLVDHGEFRIGDELLRARLGGGASVSEPMPTAQQEPEPVAAPAPAPEPAIAFTSGGGAASVVQDDDDDEDLELELEFDEPEPEPASSGPAAISPPPAPVAQPSVRDLQREELMAAMGTKKGGLLSADLDQYPAWVKALVAVGLLAFLAAIAWGVQALVLGVR